MNSRNTGILKPSDVFDAPYTGDTVSCDKSIPEQYNNPNYVSRNQKATQMYAPKGLLTSRVDGNIPKHGVNPKTLIAPIVIAPSHDLGFWRDNNLIVHSSINDQKQSDQYLSGYYVTDDARSCSQSYGAGNYQTLQEDRNNFNSSQKESFIPAPYPAEPRMRPLPNSTDPSGMGSFSSGTTQENFTNLREDRRTTRENFTNLQEDRRNTRENYIAAPYPAEPRPRPFPAGTNLNASQGYGPTMGMRQSQTCGRPQQSEHYIKAPYPAEPRPRPFPQYSHPGTESSENYEYTPATLPRPNESGWVNTQCGYNPNQTSVNLPSNLPTGRCARNSNYSQFNENLFTQTIQPGIYTTSQVIEPINSNIGISVQQQFLPTTETNDNGEINFIQRDPRMFIQEPTQPEPQKPQYDNVYDPRFTGYGTSYRSYLDPMTGQPRFMYDDVEAIRQPNYVMRSNIDFIPEADTYGPIPAGQEMGNPNTADIKTIVDKAWLDNSLSHRTEMMERLMRKRNSEMWQLRQAPMSTMTGRR